MKQLESRNRVSMISEAVCVCCTHGVADTLAQGY